MENRKDLLNRIRKLRGTKEEKCFKRSPREMLCSLPKKTGYTEAPALPCFRMAYFLQYDGISRWAEQASVMSISRKKDD